MLILLQVMLAIFFFNCGVGLHFLSSFVSQVLFKMSFCSKLCTTMPKWRDVPATSALCVQARNKRQFLWGHGHARHVFHWRPEPCCSPVAHTPAGCPADLLSKGAGPTKGWPYDSDGFHHQAEASCWITSANATTVSALYLFLFSKKSNILDL